MTNNTCTCPIIFSSTIEISRGSFTTVLCFLAILSNTLNIIVLRRARMTSSTDTLLFAISTADLVLPLLHLARAYYLYAYYDSHTTTVAPFRIIFFYLWQVFYAVSILLTLVLAGRRYVAIAYAHLYKSLCSPPRTRRVLFAIYVFSASLCLPFLFYKPDFSQNANADRQCFIDTSKEIIYTSIMMATVHMHQNYVLKVTYWSYISIFQLLSPVILAVLSVKFIRALRTKISSSRLAPVQQKTKMILLISELVLIRDLPLGLLSVCFIFFLPSPSCLTTVRLFTKEMTILLSALNLLVLRSTNERFKEAVRCRRNHVHDTPL